MKTLAILVTDVNQEKNKHLIGEIFEVEHNFSTDMEGTTVLYTIEGTYGFNPKSLTITFKPDLCFDVNKIEILEVLYE